MTSLLTPVSTAICLRFLCLFCHVSLSQPLCCYLLLLTFCFSVLFFPDFLTFSPIILCLCGCVSPPLLPFITFYIIPPLCRLVCLSCFTFPFPAVSSTLTSLSLPPLSHLSSSVLPCCIREKFVEVDLKPVCKHCYERLPDDMKRRLAKRERDSKEKKKKLLIPMCL